MTKEQRKYYFRGWLAALKGAGVCRDCRKKHRGDSVRCTKCATTHKQRYGGKG